MSDDSNELPTDSGDNASDNIDDGTSAADNAADNAADEKNKKKQAWRNRWANTLKDFAKKPDGGKSQFVKNAEKEAERKQDDQNPIRANLAKFESVLAKILDNSFRMTLNIAAWALQKKEKNEDDENLKVDQEDTSAKNEGESTPMPDEPDIDDMNEGIELQEINSLADDEPDVQADDDGLDVHTDDDGLDVQADDDGLDVHTDDDGLDVHTDDERSSEINEEGELASEDGSTPMIDESDIDDVDEDEELGSTTPENSSVATGTPGNVTLEPMQDTGESKAGDLQRGRLERTKVTEDPLSLDEDQDENDEESDNMKLGG